MQLMVEEENQGQSMMASRDDFGQAATIGWVKMEERRREWVNLIVDNIWG